MSKTDALTQEPISVIKLVIITRRFELQEAEIKSRTEKYPIANVIESGNPYLKNEQNLGRFCFNEIVKSQFGELTLAEVSNIESFTDDFKNSRYNHTRKLKLIPEADLPNFKQNFLNFYINKFNSEQKFKFKTDYLTHIHELLYNKNKGTNIFIYHHWLDKQGLPDKKAVFLTCLRNDVVSIVKSRFINAKIEINWLVHDTDILNENYDGLLWFDNFDEKGKKKSYHSVQDDTSIVRQIPAALLGDNIWCFVHQREIDSYYKRIILKIQENENPYRTAEEIYKELILDIGLFSERHNLLVNLGFNVSELELRQIAYLIDMPFDNSDQINKAVIGKIKLIQTIMIGLITEVNDKYKIDSGKLNIQLASNANQQV